MSTMRCGRRQMKRGMHKPGGAVCAQVLDAGQVGCP